MISPSAVLGKLLALLRRADRIVAGWIGGEPESPPTPFRCSCQRRVDDPADSQADDPAVRKRLLDAIGRLPKQHAITLQLLLDGLSIPEIATRLSLPGEGAARKRVQLALRLLRRYFPSAAGRPVMESRGETLWQEMASDVVPSIDLPRQLLSLGRSRAELRTAIRRLPKPYARPLLLCFDEGLSAQQLADRLHIESAARAEKLIRRALRALRIAFEWVDGLDERRPAWGGT